MINIPDNNVDNNNIYNKHIYNNGDLINISQGDNIRHGEVVPGHKNGLINMEVMSNYFFPIIRSKYSKDRGCRQRWRPSTT